MTPETSSTAPLLTPVITVVQRDTSSHCRCGAALRLLGSIDAGACCCCRDHPPTDPICQICTAYLLDTDGARDLCAKCREVLHRPSTGQSGDIAREGAHA